MLVLKKNRISNTCFFSRLQFPPSVVFKGHSLNNDMNIILGFKIFYLSSSIYIKKYFCKHFEKIYVHVHVHVHVSV